AVALRQQPFLQLVPLLRRHVRAEADDALHALASELPHGVRVGFEERESISAAPRADDAERLAVEMEFLSDGRRGFTRCALHDVAAELGLAGDRGGKFVEPSRIEEVFPARHPDLVVAGCAWRGDLA